MYKRQGEIFVIIAVFPPGSGTDWQHIGYAMVRPWPDQRILAGRNLVIKRPLVIIHKPAVPGGITGKHAGEFKHVVSGAGFAIAVRLNIGGQDIRLLEIFTPSHTADGIGAVSYTHLDVYKRQKEQLEKTDAGGCRETETENIQAVEG